MFHSTMINATSLAAISDEVILDFRNALERCGFTSTNLLKLFGKEVMRHINIDEREEDYLRRQVLHEQSPLAVIVDLLLLHRTTTFDMASLAFGANLINGLVECGLMARQGDQVGFRGFLTPLANGYFLNDGNIYNDDAGHVIQIVLEQPYLIKCVQVAIGSNKDYSQGRILDLCSGSGVIGQAIKPKGWAVTGWDINPRALDYASFNARLNNLSDATYAYADVLTSSASDERFDIVVANPPYNAIVPTSRKGEIDITLHSGVFGWDIPGAILERADNLLTQNGLFAMCGIHLMKNGIVAHPAIERMAATGSVIVLHKVISPSTSWEGMRCQFNCTPRFGELAEGQLMDIVRSVDFFDSVTWAITLWKKGGKPGYQNVYNLPTDGVLISPQAIMNIGDALG